MCKFNIGDIVVGNSSTFYAITNNHCIGKVTSFNSCNNTIAIEIIHHTDRPNMIKQHFTVDSKYFDLVIPAAIKVKEMTVAEISKELGYEVKIVK